MPGGGLPNSSTNTTLPYAFAVGTILRIDTELFVVLSNWLARFQPNCLAAALGSSFAAHLGLGAIIYPLTKSRISRPRHAGGGMFLDSTIYPYFSEVLAAIPDVVIYASSDAYLTDNAGSGPSGAITTPGSSRTHKSARFRGPGVVVDGTTVVDPGGTLAISSVPTLHRTWFPMARTRQAAQTQRLPSTAPWLKL